MTLEQSKLQNPKSKIGPSLLDNPLQSPRNKMLRAKLRAEAKEFRASQPPGIQRDTPLLPEIIAETICHQVANHLGLDPAAPLGPPVSRPARPNSPSEKSVPSVVKNFPVPPSFSSLSPVKNSRSGLKTQDSELSPSLNDYIPKLVAKAEHCYKYNRHFRKLLRARGNQGRSSLYSFMRHWLYAHLAKDHPTLARQLPQTFALGHPIPAQKT